MAYWTWIFVFVGCEKTRFPYCIVCRKLTIVFSMAAMMIMSSCTKLCILWSFVLFLIQINCFYWKSALKLLLKIKKNTFVIEFNELVETSFKITLTFWRFKKVYLYVTVENLFFFFLFLCCFLFFYYFSNFGFLLIIHEYVCGWWPWRSGIFPTFETLFSFQRPPLTAWLKTFHYQELTIKNNLERWKF